MNFPWLQESWSRVLAGRERLHHAVLIHGPAGIGKTEFARALARALLCEAPGHDGAPCGACASCNWIDQGNHPDLRELSPASADEAPDGPEGAPGAGSGAGAGADAGARARPSSKASRDIRIDQVRALERFTSVGGHRGGRLVVILDPADALNAAAANALLKTLEEPSARTQFLLVTHRPDSLPATVRSRCLALALPGPDAGQAATWLAAQAGVDEARATGWLAAAGGSPLRASRFADPTAAAAHRLVVETLAGLPETGIVRAADTLAGIEPRLWLGVLQQWVADLGRVCAGAEPRFYPDRAARLRALSRAVRMHAVEGLALQLADLARAVDHPLNPRLMLEDALMRVRTALQG